MAVQSFANQAREAIRLLTELQEIDDQLQEIAAERGDLPEEVDRLKAKIGEFEAYLSARKNEYEGAGRDLSAHFDKLNDAKERMKKYQEQLYTVKTTREYDAITHEFNFVKEEIAKTESAISDFTKRREELKRLIEERTDELQRTRIEESVKSSELAEKMTETESEERSLLHRRENVVVRLHKPLYAHYERIRKAKDGRGVARILDNACGGCYGMIPPQTQVNIRAQSDIVLCETCGRILVP